MAENEKRYVQLMAKIAEIGMEQLLPQDVSEVICVKCYKRWIAVFPEMVPLKELECPNCGRGYVIKTGQTLYEYEDDEI